MKSLKKILFFILITTQAFSQSTLNNVIPCKSDTLLNSLMVELIHQNYTERSHHLKRAFCSTKKLNKYQKTCQQKFSNLIENFPKNFKDTLPQNILISEELSNPKWNYNIQKIILDKRITTNLYQPTSKGKHPAILLFCGHERTSKATDSYQKTAMLLAKNGFVVLVIDPIGQGERIQLIDSLGNSLTSKATSEHTILNMAAMLVGWSVVEEELMDNAICMNYLRSLPFVDPNNIGCIGNSGGGTQATYYGALDDRIKAVACCSWFTKRERMFELYGPDDGCQYLADEGYQQLEIADYYIMHAPRPTLILAGTKDFIDYQGTKEAFKELKKVYRKLRNKNNVELFSVEDGHGISQPKREKSVEFFSKHLMNKDIAIEEEANTITLSEKELQCTKSGQIHIDYPNEDNLQQRLIKRMAKYESSRSSFFSNDSLAKNSVFIKNILRQSWRNNNELQLIDSLITTKKKEKRYILQPHNSIKIPIHIIEPLAINKGARIFLILNDKGIANSLQSKEIDTIIKSGDIIALADISGIGETKDRLKMNNKKFYSEDYRNASLAIFLGHSLLTQRIEDIISLIDFFKPNLSRNWKEPIINCLAYGDATSIALKHAAFLDERINHINTTEDTNSWKQIIEDPTGKNRMSLILPKSLMYYDFKELSIPQK